MKIYAISGLGADYRVFKFLSINYPIIHLDWIEPFPDEAISDYAKRLSSKITEKDNCCILGVSFGGLIAIELSKLINPNATILISSIPTASHLRLSYKLISKTKVLQFLPTYFFDPPRKISQWLFGTKNISLLKLQ